MKIARFFLIILLLVTIYFVAKNRMTNGPIYAIELQTGTNNRFFLGPNQWACDEGKGNCTVRWADEAITVRYELAESGDPFAGICRAEQPAVGCSWSTHFYYAHEPEVRPYLTITSSHSLTPFQRFRLSGADVIARLSFGDSTAWLYWLIFSALLVLIGFLPRSRPTAQWLVGAVSLFPLVYLGMVILTVAGVILD